MLCLGYVISYNSALKLYLAYLAAKASLTFRQAIQMFGLNLFVDPANHADSKNP